MTRSLLGVLLALLAGGARAADVVRNGGDVVHCEAVAGAPFSGPLVLDYLVGASADPTGIADLQVEPPETLSTTLNILLPNLDDQFAEFLDDARAQIGATPDFGRRYAWKKAALGLRDVTDEQLNLAGPLPDNCYVGTGATRTVRLQQTVARESLPGNRSVLLNYDPAAFATIQDDDLQWSFMMVHEWLWSHADDAFSVRNLNWLIHTKHFRGLSATDAAYELANHGFHAAINGPGNEHPTIQVRGVGGDEPNGRTRFYVPEVLAISKLAKEIRVVNGLDEPFTLRAGDNRLNDLCSLKTECVVSIADLPPLPTTLWIERDPLADPIWDTKMVLLVP